MNPPKPTRPPPVELPPDTLELTGELVPAVREFLRRGLSDDFLRSCVRIGAFDPYGGGRKAALVGGLRIDVHAVLKLGNEELHRHVALMNHVNGLRPRTFPLILHSAHPRTGRVFLLMEQLRGHVTLLDKVFAEPTSERELTHILNKVFAALRVIHSVPPGAAPALACLPETREPFARRLTDKLADICRADPALAVVLEQPGEVLGRDCPPLKTLLTRAAELAGAVARRVSPRLVHGDAHLGNLMVRRSGRNAYRVRLIDPNPDIGFSQPLYDVGKLLHWAGPVGWAQARPEVCRATWQPPTKGRGWRLDAHCEDAATAAEKRRTVVEAGVRQFAEEHRATYGTDFEPMLAIATAAAHVGLAALLKTDAHRAARRFVLAHALVLLAESHANAPKIV